MLEKILKGNNRRGRFTYIKKQKPYAAVLACSDSHVPPEIIFDELRLGRIFVVRVAGNCANDESVAGSLEYAVGHLKVPLLVVLGHSECGAIGAALDGHVKHGKLARALQKFAPVIKRVKRMGASGAEAVVSENIRYQVEKLARNPVIKKALFERKLSIVGLLYDVRNGKIGFVCRVG